MFILARSTVPFVVLLISLIAGIQSFKTTKLATSHQFRASRMNRDLHRIPAKLGDDSTKSNVASSFQDDPLQLNSIIQTSALMFLLSAPLGMMLDNYHGLFGVLEYNAIGKPVQVILGGHTVLKTASWVPLLFGFAGFLMSGIVLIADKILKTREETMTPSWPKVLYGISLFNGQYYLSGLLSHASMSSSSIDDIMKIIAFLGFMIFDRSRAGLFLAVSTAIGGPLAEIFLINYPHLYQYTTSDLYGIPIWIPWVYFLGAPAVGNLARRLNSDKKMAQNIGENQK